jgi:DUF4097 and DUF4098 domain-containing protein YvlB
MKKINLYSVTVIFLFAFVIQANAWSKKYQEEFHKSYPISTNGTLDLSNVNGNVRIVAWDQNEVKVDAVKYAGSEKSLADTQIVVSAGADEITIKTEFPHSRFWKGDDDEVSVDYTVTVPRNIKLNDVDLVNGNLEISAVAGSVKAATVNGTLKATDLSGETKLSTVNGSLDVMFNRLNSSKVSLSSVNGSMELKLPSSADAKIKASTVNGDISSEFGLTVDKGEFVGQNLRGVIGSGQTPIDLSNVNGEIAIRKN